MTGRRVTAALALALLGLGGCGVPTSGEPTTIPAADVPYGLAAPTPSDPTSTPMGAMFAETGIYLVTPEDTLVTRGRELPDGPLDERLDELLAALAAGPSEQERADELSTSLPPEVELTAAGVSGGTVTIDISGPVEAPSGWDSRLAVAQIVLTAISVPDVFAVRLSREGELVDAPLPDGELTSAALRAEDFTSFLTSPGPPP
jgi:hypothetical protein